MNWCVVLVTLVAACNQMYGLDATQSRDAFEPFDDEDRDGVSDAVDNCRTVANADQTNSDGDDKGDACDGCDHCMPCASGPDHDEDHDLLADSCDPCPSEKDTCTNTGQILLFDGFGALGPQWLEDGARWVAFDDRVHPAPQLPKSPYSLQFAGTGVSGTNWHIDVGIVPPPVASTNTGLYSHGALGGDASCLLMPMGANAWRLTSLNVQSMTFTANLPPVVTLRQSAVGTLGMQDFTCAILGTPHQVTTRSAMTYPLELRLHTDLPAGEFSFIEVRQ